MLCYIYTFIIMLPYQAAMGTFMYNCMYTPGPWICRFSCTHFFLCNFIFVIYMF